MMAKDPNWLLKLVLLMCLFSEGLPSCFMPKILNGHGRIKRRNKMIVSFFCKSGYSRYGPKSAECVKGRWNNAPPICITSGCKEPTIKGATLVFTRRNALMTINCIGQLVLVGHKNAYCDGTKWSNVDTKCQDPVDVTSCDFEDGEFCGWRQSLDDNFDWDRHTGPTVTGNTGPYYDHTYGPGKNNGHYLYLEASPPRLAGEKAKLISPMYPATKSGRCFRFWYHMLGPREKQRVGSLDVGILYEGHSNMITLFSVEGNQGPYWKEGMVSIDYSSQNFQIVVVGTRGRSYMSDISLDDLEFILCSVYSRPQSQTLTSASLVVSSLMANTLQPTENPITNLPIDVSSTVYENMHFTSLFTKVKNTTSTLRVNVTNGENSPEIVTKTIQSVLTSKLALKHYDTATIRDLTENRNSNPVPTEVTVPLKIQTSSHTFTEDEPVKMQTSNPAFTEAIAVGIQTSRDTFAEKKPVKMQTSSQALIGVVPIRIQAGVTENRYNIGNASIALDRHGSASMNKEERSSDKYTYIWITLGAVSCISFIIGGIFCYVKRERTKHYSDNNTENCAVYRKQSTEILI